MQDGSTTSVHSKLNLACDPICDRMYLEPVSGFIFPHA